MLIITYKNQTMTPAHFFSINIKTGTPVLTLKNEDEKTDPNYHVEEMNTAEELLESWKKNRDILNNFGNYRRTTTYWILEKEANCSTNTQESSQ